MTDRVGLCGDPAQKDIMQSLPKFAVRLFARARELAGTESITVSGPPEMRYMNVATLRQQLARACPELTALLTVSAIAVNHEFASDEQILLPLDEVAVIPPVSGG